MYMFQVPSTPTEVAMKVSSSKNITPSNKSMPKKLDKEELDQAPSTTSSKLVISPQKRLIKVIVSNFNYFMYLLYMFQVPSTTVEVTKKVTPSKSMPKKAFRGGWVLPHLVGLRGGAPDPKLPTNTRLVGFISY